MDDFSKSTVSEAVQQWFLTKSDGNVKKITLQTYNMRIKNHITNEIGLMKLNEIKTKDIYNWINGKEISNKTKNEILSILRQTFYFLKVHDLFENNVMERVPIFRIKRNKISPLTLLELKTIISSASIELEPIITFFNWTGLSTSELFALKWTDINFDDELVTISKTLRFENGVFIEDTVKHESRLREVKLFNPALEALERQRNYTGEQDFIFINPNTSKPWNISSFTNKWKKTLTKANVEYRRPHVFRATYANIMMGLGASTAWVSYQMGHRTISTLTTLHSSFYGMANQSAESIICNSLETLNL